MAGTFVARPHIQALLWAIDGAAALVMAAALLTLKHFRRGRDVVAADGRRNRVLGSAEDGGAGGRSSRSDPLARFYAPTELSSTTARRILVDCAVPPCGPPISYLARPSRACAARRWRRLSSGPPCVEFAAAGGSNGSSCTVPSVIRVVLMPVSGSKWIDWTADCLAFGLAATFALVDVEAFSAVSARADGFGRAATFGFPGCSGSARGTKPGMASLRGVGSRATRVRSAAVARRPVSEPAAGPAGGEDDRTCLRRACAAVASRWVGEPNTRASGFEARSAWALSHAA